MSKQDHIKRVIPKDDYMATIVHADFVKKKFYLWWVIDTGKFAEQKISQDFPCTEFGDQIMKRMCNRLRIDYHPTITKPNKLYPLQFIAKRGKISVDIKHIGNFTRNIITYHQPALSRPEMDVIKSKSTDHFYQEKTGRALPI